MYFTDQMRVVYFYSPNKTFKTVLNAGPAQFGIDLKGRKPVSFECVFSC